MDDALLNLVLSQLEGKPLPLRQAREFCNQKILNLEHRISLAQKLLADARAELDRLTAAEATQSAQ